MANEKNVSNVAEPKKADLQKPVTFRRRKYDIVNDDGEHVIGEFIECTATMAGESVRFKIDQGSSKMVRVLMRMHGYPLYDIDGIKIVEEDDTDFTL